MPSDTHHADRFVRPASVGVDAERTSTARSRHAPPTAANLHELARRLLTSVRTRRSQSERRAKCIGRVLVEALVQTGAFPPECELRTVRRARLDLVEPETCTSRRR